MKNWVKGLLIGIGVSIIAYISMHLSNPGGFRIPSLDNTRGILASLFPAIFLIAMGAFIGSWIDFSKKSKEKAPGERSTGFGIAGFVFGILSIPLFGVGGLFAILGIIFSSIQIKRDKTKLAIAGLILSIIGLILSIVTFIFNFIAMRNSFAG